ncbi:MAG: ShET2/EspL2 family type III secretion system effector toxin [Candidatus Endonucleobacter bathymodioli]|uniref:ShET2/EspL2 family type III secretion system effector toxin n=1 Tax=Candidatus Endonucleibacter bathymodioli TaxID=539814 RepID=A0AA90NV80_9GAMM|nr:ShET2/EspL2 family type III secretion system effector toxin [Candidatus Endonucleobacter bathymodioli]
MNFIIIFCSQIVMGLRRYYSTNEYDLARSFINKGAPRWQVCGSIIQATIKQLTSEGRYFEERPHCARKLSDSSSMKARAREEELEGKPLKAKHSNARYHDKASENSVCASVLLYMSKGRECNLNCEVCRNGELVECRHLAAWWLKLKEFEYGAIDSEENIARCKKIPCDEELDKSFNHNGCPSEGIYFEISKFHNVICDVAISLSEGQEKRYLIGSVVHVMGLCIKKNKYNNIIIYYYDPNDTLRHKEIIANTAEDLKYLYSDDFWNPSFVHCYFPGPDKVCCLLSLDTKALQKDCKVVCMHKPSANLMYLLS